MRNATTFRMLRWTSREASSQQRLRLVLGVMIVVVVAWGFVSQQSRLRASVVDRDSLAYWAAGKLLIAHQNPYGAQDVLSLQRAQGYGQDKPLVLRTPPWSLWMVLPLGFLDPYGASVAWLIVLLWSLLISMKMMWRMYGESGKPPTAFLIAGYLFAPVPACLVAGQLGIVLLLGIILFFLLEERHPFWAGAALVIPFAKPHLLSLLWPVLLIWTIKRRKWTVLGGFLTSFAVANAIALSLDPGIFSQYREMVRSATIQYEFIPALSGVIRLIFFRKFFWVQFVPMAAATVWGAHYYWLNRHNWNWKDHAPALLVMSVLTAPYAWMTDETILLPAILQGLLWIHKVKDELSPRSQLILGLFASLNVVLLLILRAKIPFATGIYFWSNLVWASWYWYARSFRRSSPVEPGLMCARATSGGQIDR
jgi:hypothetical protein